jgi:hypothetical protein
MQVPCHTAPGLVILEDIYVDSAVDIVNTPPSLPNYVSFYESKRPLIHDARPRPYCHADLPLNHGAFLVVG